MYIESEADMNTQPSLKMLKSATAYAETIAKMINIKAYMERASDIYHGIYYAWKDIADCMFNEMDIPLSANGSLDDIIEWLCPERRMMKVTSTQRGCCIEYRSGSDRIYLSVTDDDNMTLSFKPYSGKVGEESEFDISHYGPDDIAAVIAALFKANRILEARFQAFLYKNI